MKIRKIIREFEGYAKLEGDDGYCFGVHLNLLKNKKEFSNFEIVDFLDEIAKKFHGKKIKIKITVMKGGIDKNGL